MSRASGRAATDRYPYGYERAEDLAGVGIAVVIWASAVFAGVESVRKLLEHGTTSHVGVGIVAAVIGIVGNQAVARYKLVVGRRINSATLIADAKHSWLDALSSAGGKLESPYKKNGMRSKRHVAMPRSAVKEPQPVMKITAS